MVGKKKKTKICDNVSKEDRISQLPDPLISEILCHLFTKEAVRTSALSTRWRNLWQAVPELDLCSWLLSSPDVNSFVSFAERFFDPHKKSWIRKLRLIMHKCPDDKSFLNRWIDALSTRRIQHLHLSFHIFDKTYTITPLSIYTCQTLVHLRLFKATLANAEVVSLPCLKVIHLEETRCPNQATLEKLISGSPLLEDLTLIRSSSSIAKVLQVRSQTVKRIHINESAKVVIDAPLLQCLRTVIHSTKNFEIINLGFSTKLDIDVVDGHGTTYHTRLIHDILSDIARVKNLVISHVFWKDIFLYSKSGHVLQFCNLSHLNTRFCISDLEMLPTLLESCPKLESFSLELVDRSMRNKKKKEPKVIFPTVPQCLVSSLKFVKLKRSIPGNEGEIELLRYLLKNSTILEKLKLHVYYTKKAECDFLQELLTMPRCSRACEIHCSFITKCASELGAANGEVQLIPKRTRRPNPKYQ